MRIQDITLDEVSITIIFIVGLIGGIRSLKSAIRESISNSLDARFKTVNEKLDELQELITKLDIYTTKNFLVRYLSDIERETVVSEAEKQRFWEEYDHYTVDLKENSYIREWVIRLKNEGRLTR